MDSEVFEKYVADRYEDQIDWYQSKASTNKKRYQQFQWSVIALAAVVPVLVTISSLAPNTRGVIWGLTISLSMLLAIGTAGIKTFKFQENWVNYRSTAERLIQEKFFYDADVGEYGRSGDKEALFVERVETLISGENTNWVSTQSLKSNAAA